VSLSVCFEVAVVPSYIEILGGYKFISNKLIFNVTDNIQVDYKVVSLT